MKIKALAPWFGSNRTLAPHVGAALEGCEWVGVPFAGGMAELLYINARTMLVNDLHKHVINLARVIADGTLRPQLVRRLRRKLFHPDELDDAQERCKANAPNGTPELQLAEDYFVSCWMGRSGIAGIGDEFCGRTATRWNAAGGDSGVRYFGAIRAIAVFSKVFRRCTFETMDAFDFLARCEDRKGHGLYNDPPFAKAGRRYRHNCGKTEVEERTWHTRLRDALERFEETRVVCRFYEHPLVRELYSETRWEWRKLVGRNQANNDAPELLLTNERREKGLFA